MKRDCAFHCLSRHVGKGKRQAMKSLKTQRDEDNSIAIIKREEIEAKIMDYDRNHFKKAHSSAAHNDRICKNLRNNSVRDKILNGTIKRNECDYQNLHEF